MTGGRHGQADLFGEAPSSARARIERDFDPAAIRRLKESSARDITVGGPGLADATVEQPDATVADVANTPHDDDGGSCSDPGYSSDPGHSEQDAGAY